MSESTINASDVAANLAEEKPYDAQLIAEDIAEGEVKAPKVDFDADYEAAQQYSVSSIDRTEEGAKAAEAATAPKFELKQPEEQRTEAESTGDPSDFMEMAKEVNPLIEKQAD
jgi:hypothetical protein